MVYFRHNDMADLKRILEQTRKDDVDQRKKPYRTFVVIEGLYQNSGDILEFVLSFRSFFFSPPSLSSCYYPTWPLIILHILLR